MLTEENTIEYGGHDSIERLIMARHGKVRVLSLSSLDPGECKKRRGNAEGLQA